MSPLAGRRAIVTGGAQGIGAAIARGLVAAGGKVTIVDRQADKARTLAAELGGDVVGLGADLGSSGDCRAAARAAVEAMGGLDILVNNAAPGRDRGMIGRIADTDWDGHESVVLRAAAAMAEAALADLAASGRGAIVNISSILSTEVGMDQSSLAYHVSKAGLDQFTRWLAVKAGPGVRVNAVAPGLVDRDAGQKLTDNPVNKKIVEAVVPLRRAAAAAEVCAAVVFLASDAASYITGQVLRVDGGLGLHEVFGASLRAYNAAPDSGKS
jgi:3-oxoacyl-[acyl-carrier protein] reductase